MGEAKKEEDEVVTIVYKAYMHCCQCGKEMEKYLTRLEGVHRVDVDVEKSKVTVKGKVDSKKIQKKLEKKINRKVELISLSPEKANEEKKVSVTKTVLKVQIHCEKCEEDIKTEMIKLKDVYSVKTDLKAQTCTVEGIMEQQKLIEFMHRKFKKHAKLVPPKVETKNEEEKRVEIKIEKNEEKKVAPYIIHYVYAPQTFSDENPESCCIM